MLRFPDFRSMGKEKVGGVNVDQVKIDPKHLMKFGWCEKKLFSGLVRHARDEIPWRWHPVPGECSASDLRPESLLCPGPECMD